MKIVNLYRYEESHGIVVTPNKRLETDTPHSFRLIADEGKAVTNDGIDLYQCIDVASTEGWYEVDYVEEVPEN